MPLNITRFGLIHLMLSARCIVVIRWCPLLSTYLLNIIRLMLFAWYHLLSAFRLVLPVVIGLLSSVCCHRLKAICMVSFDTLPNRPAQFGRSITFGRYRIVEKVVFIDRQCLLVSTQCPEVFTESFSMKIETQNENSKEPIGARKRVSLC